MGNAETRQRILFYEEQWKLNLFVWLGLCVGVTILLFSFYALFFGGSIQWGQDGLFIGDNIEGKQENGSVIGTLFLCVLGLGLTAGCAMAMIWDVRSGSYIDPESRVFVWWHGSRPAKQKSVSADDISTITLTSNSGDWSSIDLTLVSNIDLNIPSVCIADPKMWAGEMLKVFPHIRLRLITG